MSIVVERTTSSSLNVKWESNIEARALAPERQNKAMSVLYAMSVNPTLGDIRRCQATLGDVRKNKAMSVLYAIELKPDVRRYEGTLGDFRRCS